MSMSFLRRNWLTLTLAASAICMAAILPASSAEMAKPAPEMQAVLDKLKALEAKPVSHLSVRETRTQASLADAAKAVQLEEKIASAPEAKVTVALFRTFSGYGDDPHVVALAKATLPTLETHSMHVAELVQAH